MADASAEQRVVAAIDQSKERGDTLGGVVEVVAVGLPPGSVATRTTIARSTGVSAGRCSAYSLPRVSRSAVKMDRPGPAPGGYGGGGHV